MRIKSPINNDDCGMVQLHMYLPTYIAMNVCDNINFDEVLYAIQLNTKDMRYSSLEKERDLEQVGERI